MVVTQLGGNTRVTSTVTDSCQEVADRKALPPDVWNSMSSRGNARALERRDEGRCSASSADVVGAVARDGPRDKSDDPSEGEAVCERFVDELFDDLGG